MKQVFIPAMLIAVLLASCTSTSSEVVTPEVVVEVDPVETEVVVEVEEESEVVAEPTEADMDDGVVVDEEVVVEAEVESDDIIADLDELLKNIESN